LAELTVIEKWIGVAAGEFDCGGESFFSGTVVDYAAYFQIIANFLAEFAEAFGGPAFGAPATTGAEDDVLVDTCGGEIVRDALPICFTYSQLYRADRVLRSGS